MLKRTPLKSTLSTLALSIGLLSSPLEAAVSNESQNFFNEAQSHLQSGNTNAATIQLKNAIKADPNNTDARVQLAQIYLRTLDGASAEKELRAAKSRGHAPEKILLPLGKALLLQNKTMDLLNTIDPLEGTSEERAALHNLRAESHLALGSLDKAQEEVDKALDLNQDTPAPYVVLSKIFTARGDTEGAEGALLSALEVAPNDYDALFAMSSHQASVGDFVKTIEYLTRAIEIDDTKSAARIGRATAYIALNQDDKAGIDAEAVLERNKNNPLAKYIQAMILGRAGSTKAALDTLISAKGIDQYVPALILYGTLYFSDEQYEIAREYTKRYLSKKPNDGSGNILMANILIALGETDDAIKLLERVSQSLPDDYNVAVTLANTYVSKGDYEKSAIYYDKASTLKPELDSVKLHLAQSQLNSGASKEALASLEEVIAKNPGATSAHSMLIVGYARDGEFEKAKIVIDKLKKQLPESGLPYNFEAAVALAKGDKEAARGFLETALNVQEDFYTARLNLAKIDMAEGKTDAARKQYEKILEGKPDELQSTIELIKIEKLEQNFEQANKLIDRAILAHPTSLKPRLFRLQALLDEKKQDKAIQDARQVVLDFPDNPEALEALAKVQESQGDFLAAINSYEKITKLLPKNTNIPVRIAQIQTKLGNSSEAAQAIDRLIELDPDSFVSREARIMTEREIDGDRAAINLAKDMQSELGNNSMSKVLLADAYARAKLYDEALPLYEKAYAQEKNRRNVMKLHSAYKVLGRFLDARELIGNWVNTNPFDEEARFQLSMTLISLGDYKGAIRESLKVLETNPAHSTILNNLAWLYQRQNRLIEALDFAKKAYEAEPDSPEITDTYGWMLLEQGKKEEALDLLKTASIKLPENAEIGYHYAVALIQNDKASEALKILERVVKSDQNYEAAEDAKKLYEELTPTTTE